MVFAPIKTLCINAAVFLSSDAASQKSGASSGWAATLQMLGSLLFLVLVLAGVLCLVIYSSKMIRRTKMKKGINANLSIVESLSVGFQSSICIVKAGDKFVLAGISKDKVTFLAELNPESLSFETQTGFDGYLDSFAKKFNVKKRNTGDDGES